MRSTWIFWCLVLTSVAAAPAFGQQRPSPRPGRGGGLFGPSSPKQDDKAQQPATTQPVAPLKEPARPALKELDLSDSDACLRELAELAGFGLWFNDLDGLRPN